jgi:hypothetical protein
MQAVARHLGLTDYGLREPQHWNGKPIHYWADQQPVPGEEPTSAGPPAAAGTAVTRGRHRPRRG